MLKRFATLTLIFSASLFAEETTSEKAKISEAFGHLIGKNMETIGVDLDMNLVVKGLQDAASGKQAPMTESECIEAIASAQEVAMKQKAETNLTAAESFLENNAKNKGIVSIEEGKLQYKVEKKGEGSSVKPGASPLIRYVGKYLDGSVFGKSEDDQVISLEETIPGFTKGLVGMKEGEKRTLYIHPEYGYGTQGYLPPNSLLTFEIEIVKANTIEDQFTDSLILESNNEVNVTSELDTPAMR